MEKYQPLLSLNWNLLFSVVTVLVLFLILKHFFFEKVHNFMVDREKSIQDSLDNAQNTNKIADEKLVNYEKKISNVENEAKEIISNARKEAKKQAEEIVETANVTAKESIEHSQVEIRREEYNARKSLKEEIGSLAVMAAEKIIEKELTTQDHEEIIEKVIKEAEDKSWN